MSVTSQSVDNQYATFTPNGVTTSFPFLFKLNTGDSVIVTLDGVTVSPSAYTLTISSGEGGSVGFIVAPSGSLLTIEPDPLFTQAVAFENEGRFTAATVNRTLDRSAVRDLRLKARLDRAVLVPVGETGLKLASAATRAETLLGFNESGAPEFIPGDQLDRAIKVPSGEAEIVIPSAAARRGALLGFTGDALAAAMVVAMPAISSPPTGSTVNSRSLLAAITGPTLGQTAWLAEDGYSGLFQFSTANLASAVTADPLQGKYVAPAAAPTGASGAWVRTPVHSGRLSRAYVESLPLGFISLPAAFNNQLNITPYWNGSAVKYPIHPYDLIDFTKTEATAVITFAGQPSNGETITLNGVVYTFQSTLTNVANNVKIGASASATQVNLMNAIVRMGDGTPGTDYAALTTRHQTLSASQGAGTTINLRLKLNRGVSYITASSAATNVTVAVNINVYHIDFWQGVDSGAGTGTGTGAWKTLDYAVAHAVSPAIILCDDFLVGFNSENVTADKFSGKLKIMGNHPTEHWSLIGAMGDDRSVADYAWTPSGANGCWVTSLGNNVNLLTKYRAQFDAKFRNAVGLPSPITDAGSQAAAEAVTGAGKYFWDPADGKLYAHRLDGSIPDPLDGWQYAQSAFHWEIYQGLNTSGGVLLFERLAVLANLGPSATRCGFSVRKDNQDVYLAPAGPFPTTWLGDNQNRAGARDCLAYGSSQNGFNWADMSITVVDNCHTGYNRTDGHNYHSLKTTAAVSNYGTNGAYITIYETDCTAWECGFSGWMDQNALSTSANLTTCHEGQHILRSGFRGGGCNGSAVADVNGVLSVNLDVAVSQPNRGGTASPNSAFWHSIDNPGGATANGMYLWGCAAHDNGESGAYLLSNQNILGGTAGQIYVKNWRGQTQGNVYGPIYDWSGNPL